MPDTDHTSYIVFRANPDEPSYIDTLPTEEEVRSVVSEMDFECAVLIVPVNYIAAKTCFDFVLMTMQQLDEGWTEAVSSGNI
tara:strand:- start:2189 stop:2434 length:246 start_codon:yes stop_codon:yes gene_type:complete